MHIRQHPAHWAGMAALVVATPAFSASLLSNGNFESPVIAAASFLNVLGGAEPAGFAWTVSANNVDIISNGVPGVTGLMAEGVQALDLVGFGTGGGIQQSFATAAATTYQLRFFFANNPVNTTTATAAVTVSAGSTSLLSTSVTHTTSTSSNLNWQLFTGSFAGTGGVVTLRFNNTVGGTNGGVFLDDVSVAVVPEPGAAWLMLVGLGALLVRTARKRSAA